MNAASQVMVMAGWTLREAGQARSWTARRARRRRLRGLERQGVAGVDGGEAHAAVAPHDATSTAARNPAEDVTRLQRALEGAGQSTGQRQRQLIERADADGGGVEAGRDLGGRSGVSSGSKDAAEDCVRLRPGAALTAMRAT
jgi:hypothetical protein